MQESSDIDSKDSNCSVLLDKKIEENPSVDSDVLEVLKHDSSVLAKIQSDSPTQVKTIWTKIIEDSLKEEYRRNSWINILGKGLFWMKLLRWTQKSLLRCMMQPTIFSDTKSCWYGISMASLCHLDAFRRIRGRCWSPGYPWAHGWYQIIAVRRFSPTVSLLSISISKKRGVFWGDPRIDTFFYFFIRAEMLMSQNVCHRLEKKGSRKEQRLGSTAVGVRPPISAFPSMSWPVLRHVAEHCYAGG